MNKHLSFYFVGTLFIATNAANADQYVFKKNIAGLVKGGSAPTCVDASTAEIGTISDNFCQSPGESLVKAGVLSGRQVFFDTNFNTGQLGGYGSDIPGLPYAGSAWLTSEVYSNGKLYTQYIHDFLDAQGYGGNLNYATEACLNKGSDWYLPTPYEMHHTLKENWSAIDWSQIGYQSQASDGSWFITASETSTQWHWAYRFDNGGNNLGKQLNSYIVCAKDLSL